MEELCQMMGTDVTHPKDTEDTRTHLKHQIHPRLCFKIHSRGREGAQEETQKVMTQNSRS